MLRPPPLPGTRRGFVRQRQQRLREQALREHVLELCRWGEALGWPRSGIAELLQVASRTLRRWRHALWAGLGVQALGRPVLHSPRAARQEVLELLDELGPGVGLPTLRECFPELLRAELEDLLRRYRRVWRRRHQGLAHALEWTTPGSVWAADFAEAPAPIDGAYPYLLAVRDLASGRQPLWLPAPAESAAEAVNALASLVVLLGPPLVLKSGNGSAFVAGATQALLAGAGVIPLFSPAYTPQYNGSAEAGIGSLKTRTERHAARCGHPGVWTSDDAARAQAEANALAHPGGERGPTPDAAWSSRRRLTPADRALFEATVGLA